MVQKMKEIDFIKIFSCYKLHEQNDEYCMSKMNNDM